MKKLQSISAFILLLLIMFGISKCNAQLNYNAKSVYFTNADSVTVRANAALCGDCGFIYYNKQHNPGKFRIYQDSVWYDLLSGGSGNFWQLSDTSTFTGSPTINGNNTDLNFISLNSFGLSTIRGGAGILLQGLNNPSGESSMSLNSSGNTITFSNGTVTRRLIQDVTGNTWTGPSFFSHTATLAGFNLVPFTGNPSSPNDGDLWYNSTTNALMARINGSSVALGSGGITGLTSGLIPVATSSTSIGNSTISFSGTKASFAASSTSAGINIGSVVGNPSSTSNGDLWYNSGVNSIVARINGASRTLAYSNASPGNMLLQSLSGVPGALDNANITQAADGKPTFQNGSLVDSDINIVPRAANPTTPVNGDFWYKTGTGFTFRNESTNVTPIWNNQILTGSATLDFPSTTTSVSDLTITVTGATVGKPCTVGVPDGSVTTTASYWCWVSASNTVTVRFSPKATGGEDPASGTFSVVVDNR